MNNLKPSVLPSLSEIYHNIEQFGFTDDDLVTLIQRRTKLTRADIETTLDALFKLEKQIIRSENIRREQLFKDMVHLLRQAKYKEKLKVLLV